MSESATERGEPTAEAPLDEVLIGDREHWVDGPPYELFARMRGSVRCTGPRRSATTPRRTASGP